MSAVEPYRCRLSTMATPLPRRPILPACPASVHSASRSRATSRPRNKSASTLLTYGKAVEQFGEFVTRSGMPPDVGDLRREHIEAFRIDPQAQGWKPASVANRYRSLPAVLQVAGRRG